MPIYVALGSSFASGPGIEPIVDARCGRSGSNYAHLVAGRLGYDLIDVTCGGAAVDDLLTRPQSLMSGGTVPPQIEAVVPDADLVTVTVGGNDIEYLLTLLRCSHQADPDGTPVEARAFFGTPVDPAAVEAGAGRAPREAGRPGRRRPEAGAVRPGGARRLPDGRPRGRRHGGAAAERRAPPVLRGRRRGASPRPPRRRPATTGVDLVEASAASAGHHAGSAEPWVTGWEFGDVLAGGVVPYHPNAAGMRAVADLLVGRLG